MADTRIFMFRGKEAKLFESLDDVPAGEGWQDAPYELDEASEKPSEELTEQLRASVALGKKGKKKSEADTETPVDDGDSN